MARVGLYHAKPVDQVPMSSEREPRLAEEARYITDFEVDANGGLFRFDPSDSQAKRGE